MTLRKEAWNTAVSESGNTEEITQGQIGVNSKVYV